MKTPHIPCLLIVLLLLGACQSNHVDGPGHRQAELRHEKAIKFHQYFQNEVAILLNVREEINKVIAGENLTPLISEELKEKDCQIENFQELLQRQANILEDQKKYLREHETQRLTIRQREIEHNQIRNELGAIKQEVLLACSQINKLTAAYKQTKNELPVLAALQ